MQSITNSRGFQMISAPGSAPVHTLIGCALANSCQCASAPEAGGELANCLESAAYRQVTEASAPPISSAPLSAPLRLSSAHRKARVAERYAVGNREAAQIIISDPRYTGIMREWAGRILGAEI